MHREDLPFALFGLFILVSVPLGLALPEWLRGLASRSWPITKGRILVSKFYVNEPEHPYSPAVFYEYHVGGTRYEGRVVRYSFLGDYRRGYFRQLQLTLNQYPVGHEITVHYNPHRPERAVLETGVRRNDVIAVFTPYLLLPIVALLINIFARAH